MIALRRAHIEGVLSSYPTCAECPEPECELTEEDAKKIWLLEAKK